MTSLPRIATHVAAITAAVLVSTTVTVASATAATIPPRPGVTAAAASSDLATGLQVPWAMAPLVDGAALVTERNTGRIYRIQPGRARQLVKTIPGVVAEGEGGLLGIALSSTFKSDHMYFVYYTTATDNRVAVVYSTNNAAPRPIVTGIRKAGNHNGGGLIVRGRDLYIGTGDAGDRSLAQNTTSLNGKIMKVDYNGKARAGNKWGRVFSIGHRNVQGFTSSPLDNALYATELGQDTQDELNWIRPGGRNYGWPTCEGSCGQAGFTNPIHTWAPSEASPSGVSYVRVGNTVTFYVGALRGQRLWRLKITNGVVQSAESRVQGTYGRIRGVLGRGDGSLWITTSQNDGNDRVVRISPAP